MSAIFTTMGLSASDWHLKQCIVSIYDTGASAFQRIAYQAGTIDLEVKRDRMNEWDEMPQHKVMEWTYKVQAILKLNFRSWNQDMVNLMLGFPAALPDSASSVTMNGGYEKPGLKTGYELKFVATLSGPSSTTATVTANFWNCVPNPNGWKQGFTNNAGAGNKPDEIMTEWEVYPLAIGATSPSGVTIITASSITVPGNELYQFIVTKGS